MYSPALRGDGDGELDLSLYDDMAGIPLFAHAGREKLTLPPLSAPLELIKFCGTKTQISLIKVLGRRTGLVFACFAPQITQKREESRIFSEFCFPRKTNSPPPGPQN